jgi:hypothetical protein
MSKPDFGEALFLVAFIIFALEAVVILTKKVIVPAGLLLALGLAVLAFGFLAL